LSQILAYHLQAPPLTLRNDFAFGGGGIVVTMPLIST